VECIAARPELVRELREKVLAALSVGAKVAAAGTSDDTATDGTDTDDMDGAK